MTAVMWGEPGGEIRWQPQLRNGKRRWEERGYKGEFIFGTYWATKPKGKNDTPVLYRSRVVANVKAWAKKTSHQKGMEPTMTTINDLEERIEGAEDALTFVKDQLAELKTHLQELKEQEKDKQPESLFGRWATHPEHGRGIITDVEPDTSGEVEFAFPDNEDRYTRTSSVQVAVDNLTLDPATLTTAKDFLDAPEGTIVEIMVEPKDVYVKADNLWYGAGEDRATSARALTKARVIRWGNGQ